MSGVASITTSPCRSSTSSAEIRAAYEAYASDQAASFIPLVEKITDIKVIDAGQATSVTLDPGYQLLSSLTGDTIGGSLSCGIWKDTKPANYVFVAYRSEVTDRPVGVSEVHVSSTDPAVVDLFFGGAAGAGHDAIYGSGRAGCLANAGVDLNSGTCGAAKIWDWYSAGCVVWMWSASCTKDATPLALHYVLQTAQTQPIRCLVVGDEVAVDANQPLATRVQHIYWGPGDANQDATKDNLDATWVLQHVQWVKQVPNGALVNLNHGTQSYRRYNWKDCWFDEGYDDAWIHDANAVEDALYIGYCLP